MVRATCTPGSGRHASTEAEGSFWVCAFPLPSWLAAFIPRQAHERCLRCTASDRCLHTWKRSATSIACGAPVEEALAYSVPRSRLTCVILGMLSHPGGSGFGLPVRHEARRSDARPGPQ